MIGVLDLCFSKRGAAMDAPVHRLLALVDEALLDELPERPRDGALILVVHRQVQVVPVADHEQALELLVHDADEPLGVRAAGTTEVSDRHVALLRTELAIDFELDRQAMAVVAQDVRRVEAGHRPRSDDEVLQNLVESRAEVDVAVRVRRAVVQHELAARPSGAPESSRRGPSRSSVRATRARPSEGSPS